MGKHKNRRNIKKLEKCTGKKEQNFGIDFSKKDSLIEYADRKADIISSVSQLMKKKSKKKKYLAVPPRFVEIAKEKTKGTGIGVMTPNCDIKKRTRRVKP